MTFKHNHASGQGGAVVSQDNCNIYFGGSTAVVFINTSSTYGGAVFSSHYSVMSFGDDSSVVFNNNSAEEGGSLYSQENSSILFDQNVTVTFTSNTARVNGGAIRLNLNCTVTLVKTAKVKFYTNTAAYGGAIYSQSYSILAIDGSSTLAFTGNKADKNGGAINFQLNSRVLLNENSMVALNVNGARNGGAVLLSFSSILLGGNSTMTFTGNKASLSGGAVYSSFNSTVSLVEKSKMKFDANTAASGGAIYSHDHSALLFNGCSTSIFSGNKVSGSGGAISSFSNSTVLFIENSKVIFNDNSALYGGAFYSKTHSTLVFDGNSTATFSGNYARFNGGGIIFHINCNVFIDGNTTVTFIRNNAENGGGVCSMTHSQIKFSGYSLVTFNVNNAVYGGAMLLVGHSTVAFDRNSTVLFNGNSATYGGAIFSRIHCIIIFDRNSRATFDANKAANGGAIYSNAFSIVMFNRSSRVTYLGNIATSNGGAISCNSNCSVLFDGNTKLTFSNNSAEIGAAVYSGEYSRISLDGNTSATFDGNSAMKGGALGCENSYIQIDGNSVVRSINNRGTQGGVMYSSTSYIRLQGDSLLEFDNNIAALEGGVIYSHSHCDVTLKESVSVVFTNNSAKQGGAIFILHSSVTLSMHSVTRFDSNSAVETGGAIFLSSSFTATFKDMAYVVFLCNTAKQFGGAIYGELKSSTVTEVFSHTTDVLFHNNTALLGPDVYMHIQRSCDNTCLNNSIVGLNVTHNYPPRKIVLYDPAICISGNQTKCEIYFVKNVMLGQDIEIGACVLSLSDEPADGTDFVVTGSSQNHSIEGPRLVSISCKAFEGISIVGNEVSNLTNFSLSVLSYTRGASEISIEIITEISPCYPGFVHNDGAQRCTCYNSSDIVSCTGSISFIKKGYWFGVMNDRPTVTICPNNYCNFTCCETSNGFYQLSPVRTNQCTSHRSGTACGSCEEGYTLSFDSVECVSVHKCTTGQTVLVVTLSMIYWIAMVVLVFIMTYYHVGIGYLYAITYYFSMLDIIVSQNLYQSKGLFKTVTIVSSLSKITPHFLGQLCLVQNMSGIDQQFIHFAHPLAVSVMLVIICQSARISYKFSSFISRGIIRTICFLLLLSYTSVATTSLLLLRSLTFDNVNKVYTYLSPDIEYCHGRHLPYFIVAVLCTLVIVIGLPLLLLLEPFLKHKINFTRMKPLLDQFQGCYKDNYRCFAAYYMFCRLAIIMIIIANPSNNDLSQFLLICSSVVLAAIPIILKPYEHKILNIFDGLVLQLVVLATLIPLADNVSQQLSTATIIIAMILPLIFFTALELIVHKEAIKTIATRIISHFKTEPVTTTDDNNEAPKGDIGIFIDDNMRKNATICKM